VPEEMTRALLAEARGEHVLAHELGEARRQKRFAGDGEKHGRVVGRHREPPPHLFEPEAGPMMYAPPPAAEETSSPRDYV
jgi:hypothetical protein